MRGFVRYRQGKLQLAEEDCRHGLRPRPPSGPGRARTLVLARSADRSPHRARPRPRSPFARRAVRLPRAVPERGRVPRPAGRARRTPPRPRPASTTPPRTSPKPGTKLERRGVDNPAWCAWRVNLAKALTSTDPEKAYEHACEALRRAYRFGAPSAMGQALRVAGRLEGGPNGLAKIEDAAMWLEHSDSRYEYAVSLIEYGMALRRELGDRDAADALFEGLTVAVECGADRLANAAREMLVDMGELVPASHAGLEGRGAEGMR
ncbi:hypothetical protein ACU686_00970 [Yinghuangia aomiensis]